MHQGDEIVYVARISSSQGMMRVVQIIHARAPLYVTAVRKLLLLEDGADEGAHYAARTVLPRDSSNTLSDLAELTREFDRVRGEGYAFDHEEAEKSLSCIEARIRDDEGRLVAGLSVSAPSDRLNCAWAATVKETADQISPVLGYRARGY